MEIGKDVQRAAALLGAGGSVIVPTETSYGLAVDATNPAALAALFAVKRRKPTEPVGLFLHDMVQVERHFFLAPEERRIAERYWPGAVNLVLRPHARSPLHAMMPHLALEKSGMSVRVSSHPVVQAFTAACGVPITSTSANRSGEGDVYDPARVVQIFTPDEIAYFFDGGVLPKEKPSTVVEWNGTAYIVHRQGAVHIVL